MILIIINIIIIVNKEKLIDKKLVKKYNTKINYTTLLIKLLIVRYNKSHIILITLNNIHNIIIITVVIDY